MPSTTHRRIGEIDHELAELGKRDRRCWDLIERAFHALAESDRYTDALLAERLLLMDDGR